MFYWRWILMDRKCAVCGSVMREEAKFCNICGATMIESTPITYEGGGPQVSSGDAQEIISRVRGSYAGIPAIVRHLVPPLPSILRTIPECARKYTLQQIIDLLEEAHARGEI
jgi:hypothetical protein